MALVPGCNMAVQQVAWLLEAPLPDNCTVWLTLNAGKTSPFEYCKPSFAG
jgi:hypothetical protein